MKSTLLALCLTRSFYAAMFNIINCLKVLLRKFKTTRPDPVTHYIIPNSNAGLNNWSGYQWVKLAKLNECALEWHFVCRLL